jgi:hypothetical protein
MQVFQLKKYKNPINLNHGLKMESEFHALIKENFMEPTEIVMILITKYITRNTAESCPQP